VGVALLVGGFVLLLALCGAIQLWYGTYRMKRRERNAADGQQAMLGDFDRPEYPKDL
jgi:hypothetical protein